MLHTPEGQALPRSLLLRGDGAVIIPVLTCRENQKVYTLMVRQRRIVDGSWTTEFPAGSVDSYHEEPLLIATQELQEELGIEIDPSEIHSLYHHPLNPAPSIMSAQVHFFYFQQEVSSAFLREKEGCSTGCHEDHEYLTVEVKEMSEVSRMNENIFVIAGIKLLENKLNRIF